MKKTIQLASLTILIAGAITSCQKTTNDALPEDQLSQAEKSLISTAGFNGSWASKTSDGNYLVEGDILISKEQLTEMSASTPSNNIIVADNEHYNTYNLVNTGTGIRTLYIFLDPNFPTYYSTALNNVILKYNALNLNLKFARASSSSSANILVKAADLGGPDSQNMITLGMSDGFPQNGNPAPGFTISSNPAAAFAFNTVSKMEILMQHEMGHNIGFRHSDYKNRISCGGGRESAGTIGAVNIPGTPGTITNSAYMSWMMACNSNNPLAFTSADIVALQYVY